MKAFGVIGGVNPFIRFRLAGSNGLVGAISGAKTEDSTMRLTTNKEITATRERLKE